MVLKETGRSEVDWIDFTEKAVESRGLVNVEIKIWDT
jgi:hypothetical protein